MDRRLELLQNLYELRQELNGGKGSGRRPFIFRYRYKKASEKFYDNFAAPSLFKTPFHGQEEKMVQDIRKSIRQGKKVNPIAIMKNSDNGYTIIDGYHRMRAFYLERRVPRFKIYKSKEHYCRGKK